VELFVQRILPDDPSHPPEQSGQVPIWQHNSWFGDSTSHQFGTTSGTLGTGTVPWVFLTILENDDRS
jgi:hypothetical protein